MLSRSFDSPEIAAGMGKCVILSIRQFTNKLFSENYQLAACVISMFNHHSKKRETFWNFRRPVALNVAAILFYCFRTLLRNLKIRHLQRCTVKRNQFENKRNFTMPSEVNSFFIFIKYLRKVR